MKKIFVLLLVFSVEVYGQQSAFEKSGGNETATYFEAIEWYKKLADKSKIVSIKTMGFTDAGYPLHLVMLSTDGNFDPVKWHREEKLVILINNGIHPGEPDGIDASMMLVRDIINNKVSLPSNVVLALIPVYNIGGSLNRNSYTRANQNGPVEYGFRGNAQNLDLNRDFTKSDTKNARSFAQIFHYLNPDILVDNHVSDGADYQHTMTLITTQYNKLGNSLGNWVREIFEPKIYSNMAKKGWEMIPYVDFGATDFSKGMTMFMDPPRYSSGYAALFNTISFMPETHMLKPYRERVKSTSNLMQTFIEEGSKNCTEIKKQRALGLKEWMDKKEIPLKWKADKNIKSEIVFKGYEVDSAKSEATGLDKILYNHAKPFTRDVKFFHHFIGDALVTKPRAYVISAGYWQVIELLQLNNVQMKVLKKDSTLNVSSAKIMEYKSYPTPYEKHHKNYGVKTTVTQKKVTFLKGDVIVYLNQPASRYLVEMLEPTGDDSFFAWNFFDGILQQKEGYSDYRWEDLASEVLKKDLKLQEQLAKKKAEDPAFANNSGAILDYIYRNSAYYEKAHMQYPVYRIEN